MLPGSPNLQLNSSTFGPAFVIIRPAYNTPKKDRPSFRKPSTVASITYFSM